MIDVILNHPILNPMEVFGAIFLGTFTGSLRDPIILTGYLIVVVAAFRKVPAILIAFFIISLLGVRFWVSVGGQFSDAKLIGSVSDRLFGSFLVALQLSIVALLARMVRSIEVVTIVKNTKFDNE